WDLYDAMIGGIPEDCLVKDLVCGHGRVLVESELGFGFSGIVSGRTRPVGLLSKLPGTKLRDLAACVKSWNLEEASVGQAAINAYYNALPVAMGNGVPVSHVRFAEDRIHDPFISYQNAIRGKKVAVVGHFHYLDQLFRPVCDLSVLEFVPQEGDYPEWAAEALLPEAEFVVITAVALINKSLPRLLALAKGAKVVLVGPSTPMAPVLREFGVSDLSGIVIKDGEKARRICSGQENLKIYSSGQKVSLRFS
ncbi:MAG: putative heavy-metal chelation, partial [Paenibacillaceae bacterium]|nr:putative heavy-metal chelation [Paenibacillaceae bacterium]